MKKIQILSVIFLLLIASCQEEPDLRMPDIPKAPTLYMLPSADSDEFIDFNDPGSFNLQFDLGIMYDDPFERATIAVSRNGDYANQYIVVDNITTLPQTLTITAEDIVNAIPEYSSASDISQGDQLNFFINVTTEEGDVFTGISETGDLAASPAVVNALAVFHGANAVLNKNIVVPCATLLIPGTYTCVANGFSTDPNPPEGTNPAVDYTTEVTLSQGSNFFTFTLSEFSGGLFSLWYSVYGLEGEFPVTIQDICGDIQYVDMVGPFGSPITGLVTVDDDGIITIEANAVWWGDSWTLVLTPNF